MTLTDRQDRIMAYLDLYTRSTGYPPSIREVGAAVDLDHKGSVHAQLTNLRFMGLVDWEDGRQRTLHLTNAGRVAVAERRYGLPRRAVAS